MGKVLSNPFATQPVAQKSVSDHITDLGTHIDTFFDNMYRACGWQPESKRLPARPEYLTFEDDTYDLGGLTWQEVLVTDSHNQPRYEHRLVRSLDGTACAI